MSEEKELSSIISKHRYVGRVGAFFSGAAHRPIGSGLILNDCYIPYFDRDENKFLTGRGLACVITHECDVDPENDRFFNEKVLIIPVIDFKVWYSELRKLNPEIANNIATGIVRDEVYRTFYLPTIPGTGYEYGGILYLNEITNTTVESIKSSAKPVCSLTTYSHNLLDIKLQNHLFRPKAVPLMTIH